MKQKISKAEWLEIFGEWAARRIHVSKGPAYLTLLSTGRCNLSCFMYFHNTVKEIPVLINAEAVEPFLHEEFAAWWQPANGGHAIVAVLYNNEARTGYEEVEVIVASLTAGHKIGLTPGGGVVPL